MMTNKELYISTLLGLISCLAFPVNAQPAVTDFFVVTGADEAGRPTAAWLEAIERYHDPEAHSEIARTQQPFSQADIRWLDLIRERSAHWPSMIPRLLLPFGDVLPPAQVNIIVGNAGGSDAFIANDVHIAFDVRRMEMLFGSDNAADRIDRFFAHEFTHLLHREWRRANQPVIETHLEKALWSCLTEGLGVYRSMSARWTTERGELSPHAIKVLENLQPVFVDRLARLQQAGDTDEAMRLAEGLSFGPFEEKWGALPVALWLALEAKTGDTALRKWVDAGPWGVIELAAMYLPADLAKRLPRPGQ